MNQNEAPQYYEGSAVTNNTNTSSSSANLKRFIIREHGEATKSMHLAI
jgi:hypothetical protein